MTNYARLDCSWCGGEGCNRCEPVTATPTLCATCEKPMDFSVPTVFVSPKHYHLDCYFGRAASSGEPGTAPSDAEICPECHVGLLQAMTSSSEPEGIRRDRFCPNCSAIFASHKSGLRKVGGSGSAPSGGTPTPDEEPANVVVCPGCSEASGSGMPVYHEPPICAARGSAGTTGEPSDERVRGISIIGELGDVLLFYVGSTDPALVREHFQDAIESAAALRSEVAALRRYADQEHESRVQAELENQGLHIDNQAFHVALAEARAALARYGTHLGDCDSETGQDATIPCSCGFDAARALPKDAT